MEASAAEKASTEQRMMLNTVNKNQQIFFLSMWRLYHLPEPHFHCLLFFICAAAFCLCHTSPLGWYFPHLSAVVFYSLTDSPIFGSHHYRSLHPSVAPPSPLPPPPTSYVSVTKDPFRKYQSASLRGWFEWNLRRSSRGLLSPEYTNIMSATVNTHTDSLYFSSLELRFLTMVL